MGYNGNGVSISWTWEHPQINCMTIKNVFLKFEPLTRLGIEIRSKYFWESNPDENPDENPDDKS